MYKKNSNKFSLKTKVISYLTDATDADIGNDATVEQTKCKTCVDATCPNYSKENNTCGHECHETNGPVTNCKCMTDLDCQRTKFPYCNGNTGTIDVFPDKTIDCNFPKYTENECQSNLCDDQTETCIIASTEEVDNCTIMNPSIKDICIIDSEVCTQNKACKMSIKC